MKIDSADPVVPGQAFTYTLTVTNNGPSDAATVQVSDTVPAQFTVTNVTSPSGSCGHVGNAVTCTRPTLAAAASWVITVSVTANLAAPAGHVHEHRDRERCHGGPGARQRLRVAGHDASFPSADLSIVKTDSADPISPGTSFDYTIVGHEQRAVGRRQPDGHRLDPGARVLRDHGDRGERGLVRERRQRRDVHGGIPRLGGDLDDHASRSSSTLADSGRALHRTRPT